MPHPAALRTRIFLIPAAHPSDVATAFCSSYQGRSRFNAHQTCLRVADPLRRPAMGGLLRSNATASLCPMSGTHRVSGRLISIHVLALLSTPSLSGRNYLSLPSFFAFSCVLFPLEPCICWLRFFFASPPVEDPRHLNRPISKSKLSGSSTGKWQIWVNSFRLPCQCL